jgi:DNA-binding MarR family transcriptional regulator
MYIEKTNISKSPEGMLKAELVNYYGLSNAESDILWERLENFVKEHFENCIFDNQTIRYAVSKDEPAGKPIKYCKLVPVKITLVKPSDKKIREKKGPLHLREVLSLRFANEAYSQGGLFSQEDLAEILFVNTRTVKRIISRLKAKGIDVPTRGLVKDIGPTISHKAKIVELALKRYTSTEIAFKTRHSLTSIARYIENFIKVVYLFEKDFTLAKISRITKISEKVAAEYRSLYEKYIKNSCLKERLDELSGYIGSKKGGKK